MSIWIIVLTTVMQTIYNNNKFKNKQGQKPWYQIYIIMYVPNKKNISELFYITMSYTIKAITWGNL